MDRPGHQRRPPGGSARGALGSVVHAARRAARRAAAALSSSRLDVVFHAGYAPPDSAILDSRRAAKILDHLFAEGWLSPSQVHVPRPLDIAALRRVHDDGYLASLDAPSAVARALGGEAPPQPKIAEGYLAAQRWATAGTVHAARLALARSELAVSLGGGFHHAERARGGGFCLFHDVAVALEDLRSRGFGGRVLVLDLDLHQGDGTRAIYRDDPAVVAASLHASAWDESPAPYAIDLALGSGVGDATYLDGVLELLERSRRAGEPDLVFYVAGVDVALEDTLGSWRVSADAIAERDRIVLSRMRGRPVVMVLAGGYGQEAWRHTARTLVWLLSGEDRRIPDAHDVGLRQFRRVAGTFGEDQLTDRVVAGDNFGITQADVTGDLGHQPSGDHLLGFYTVFGLEHAFERYGLTEHLRERGYPRVRVELDPLSRAGESLTVRTDDAERLVLVELVVREMREVAPYRLLSIEWLCLQDPRARPTPDRPLLPGQRHPGLGGLKIVMGMLSMAAERLGFDGLTFLPAHYHTAAQARGLLRFLDPSDEATFLAIKDALGPRSLFAAARLIAAGGLVDARTGERYTWKPARMVIPVSAALREAVGGAAYDHAVEEAAGAIGLRLRSSAPR